MRVRQLIEQDLEPCIALFIEVFNQPPWNNEWTQDVAARLFGDFWGTPGFRGYVAIDDSDEIVGAMLGRDKHWWQGKEFLIEEFYVQSDMQGRGVGSQMIEFASRDIRSEGIETITLFTNADAPAHDFYIKRQFTEHQTLRMLYKNI